MHDDAPVAWAALDLVCCLLLVVFVLIAPPPAPPAVDAPGVYLIRVTWPEGLDVDVDSYVETPSGQIVFFANPEAGAVHLERDDLGVAHDPGVRANEERVTLRAATPGEYLVNLHAFRNGPVAVDVRLYRIEGADKLIVKRAVRLRGERDERTAFRFTLNQAGRVSGVSYLPKLLVGATVEA